MVAGLSIALFTAVMTYIIIDEPIGMKMISKIALTIVATLPIIGLFSYYIGVKLSKKFDYIATRLDAIHENKFINDVHHDKIVDITKITTLSMNYLLVCKRVYPPFKATMQT